jgi:hypothetical protein
MTDPKQETETADPRPAANDPRERAKEAARDAAENVKTLKSDLDLAKMVSVERMKELHALDVSWAEIGRIFGMSGTAAMYATGHAQRTPKTKAAD